MFKIGIIDHTVWAPNWLLTNLVAYYKHDTNGSFPSEVNSPSNDLTINGSTYTASGKINWWYTHDWTNDRIEKDSNLGISSFPFSVWGWIKINDSWFRSPFWFFDKDVDNNYSRILLNSWVPQINLRDSINSGTIISNAWALSTGTWYHIIWVWTNATTMDLYQNWVNVNWATAWTINANPAPNFDRFSIARSWDSTPSNYLDGSTDEIWIWDKALTSTDASNLYNWGSGLPFSSFTT